MDIVKKELEITSTMSERVEKRRTRKWKLEEIRHLIRHLIILRPATEIITKVRNKSEQKTNRVYVDNAKFHYYERKHIRLF